MARNKHLAPPLLQCDLCNFSSKNLYIYRRHRIRCRKEHGLTKGKKGETTNEPIREEQQSGQSLDLFPSASNDDTHESGPELAPSDLNDDAPNSLDSNSLVTNKPANKPMPSVQRNYSCTKCDLKTSRSRVFLFHMIEAHGCKFSIYACQECEYCSKYKHKLQRHVKFAHKIEVAYDEVVAEYEHEDKKKSPTIAKKPKQKHSGKLMVKFGKSQAPKMKTKSLSKKVIKSPSKSPSVRSSDQLSRVVEEITGEDGNVSYKCRECPFVSDDMQKVAKHMVSWHVDIKHFNCTACGYICFERNDFLTHRLSHRSEHKYKCEECTYSTDFRPNFDRHLINHKGSYPFKCSFCSYGCGSDPAIRRHMAVNHESLQVTAKTKLKFPAPKSEVSGVEEDSFCTDQSQVGVDGQSDIESDTSGIFKPSSTVSFYGSARKKLPAPTSRAKSLSPVRKLPPNISIYVKQKDGRLVCPACTQKGYTRLSDLNRHMKKKHDCRLREYLESMVGLPEELSLDIGDNNDSMVSGTEGHEEEGDAMNVDGDDDDVGDGDYMTAEDNDKPIEVIEEEEGEDFIVTETETTINTEGMSEEQALIANRLLKCKYCDFSNKFPSKLKRHLSVHALEKQYRCAFCPKTYPDMGDLRKHMKKYHSKLPSQVKLVKVASAPKKKNMPSKYKCPCCSFSSGMKAEVERHTMSHTGGKKYQCIHCDYQSYWRGDVRRHMYRRHSENMSDGSAKEKVIYMKKVFPSPGATDSSNEPSQPDNTILSQDNSIQAQVEQSPESTPTKDNSSHESSPDITLAEFIQRERSSMSPSSPVKELSGGVYKCLYCGFEANSPSKINNHIESHTNLKRYMCPLCGRRSNWKWDIAKHLKLFHNDDVSEVVKLTRGEAEKTIQAYMEANPTAHRDHHKNAQPEAANFRCSACNYTSEKLSSINRHIGQRHEQEVASGTTVRAEPVTKPLVSPPTATSTPTMSSAVTQTLTSTPTQSQAKVQKESSSTPVNIVTPSKYTYLMNQTPPSDSNKPFMCSECGKRGNSKADIKKHFHYVHPNKEIRIIYLGEGAHGGNTTKAAEGNQSPANTKPTVLNVPQISPVQPVPVSTEGASLHNPKEIGYIKPFKCAHCGRRSNWRWDTLKHIRERHPGQDMKIIELSEKEARDSIGDYIKQKLPLLNRISGSVPRKQISKPVQSTKGIMVEEPKQVDTNERDLEGQYKRYKCSACAYRAKLKSDCKRHILRRHGARAKVIVMSLDEAKATIGVYKYKRQQNKPLLPDTEEEAKKTEWEDMEEGILSDPQQPQPSPSKQKLIGWKRWKCTMCTQLFDEKVDALRHLIVHNMKAYKCTGCLWTSNFRSAVRKHVKNRHPEGTASCKVSVKLWRFKQNAEGFKAQTVEKKQQLELEHIRQMEEKIIEKEKEIVKEKENEEVKDELMAVYCCKMCTFRSRWRSCVCRHLKSNHNILDYTANLVKKIIRLNSSKGQEILALSKKPSSKLSTPTKSPASGSETDGSSTSSSKRSSDRPRNFVCSICPYKSYKRRMLKFHMTCHKPQPGVKQVKCKYCPYYVNGARLLTQHMNLHIQDIKTIENEVIQGLTTPTKQFQHPVGSPVSNKRHKCEKCPYTSNSKNDYLYHKQFHRPKPTADYKCDYCDYWVTHRRLIKQHMKVHQQHDNSLFVRPSPVATPTKSDYSENSLIYDTVEIAAIKQRIIASKITPSISQTPIVSPMKIASSCVLGGKRGFMRKDGTYRKIHRCRHCPYMNIRLRNMKLHELMHGKRSATHPLMKCPHCDYFVGSKGLLGHHLKVHQSDYGAQFVVDKDKTDESASEESGVDSNSIPVQSKVDTLLEIARFKKYGCEKCPYASAKRARFQRHAELHGSRQKYKCDYCDYSVPTTILLRQHERLHYQPNQNLLAAQSILNLQYLPEMPADVALASMLTNNDSRHPVSVTHDHIDLYENTTEDTEPKKIYRCDRCPYANIRRDHLLAHLRCHMIKNTFSCPYCDYSVGKIHVLMQHVKVHFSPLPELSEWLNENGDAQRIKEVKEKDLKEAIELAKLFQNEPGRAENSSETDTDKPDVAQEIEVNGSVKALDKKETQDEMEIQDTSMNDDKKKEEKKDEKAGRKKDTGSKDIKMETEDCPDLKPDGTMANGEDSNTDSEKMEVDQNEDGDQGPPKVDGDGAVTEGYVCQYCDRDFQTSDCLVRHEMQHLIGNSYEDLVTQFMNASPIKEELGINGESVMGGASEVGAGTSGVKAGPSGEMGGDQKKVGKKDSIISVSDTDPDADTIIFSSSSQDVTEPMDSQ